MNKKTDLLGFEYSLQTLIAHDVHLGHYYKKWNPKMSPYLLGIRNDLHIIDLEKTVIMLKRALHAVRTAARENAQILFVSNNPSDHKNYAFFVENAAKKCNQPFLNKRWIGGLLTNYIYFKEQIKNINDQLSTTSNQTTYKKYQKFLLNTHGIQNMTSLPSLIFIVGIKESHQILKEANKLNIPTIGIIDSNTDPSLVTYPIPGNDDSIQAVHLYCQLISNAILDATKK